MSLQTTATILGRLIKIKGFTDCFYSISSRMDCVTLQGNYTPELAKFLAKRVGNPIVDDNGYLNFSKYNIEVILT